MGPEILVESETIEREIEERCLVSGKEERREAVLVSCLDVCPLPQQVLDHSMLIVGTGNMKRRLESLVETVDPRPSVDQARHTVLASNGASQVKRVAALLVAVVDIGSV